MSQDIRAMQELDQEIEELEKLISGTPPEEPTKVINKEEKEPTPEVIAQPQSDLQKELEDSQKRFNSYKGSTDKTIFDLRQENQSIKDQLSKALGKIKSLESQPKPIEDKSITSYLSEEDKEILGTSAVDALDKSIKAMVESQVDPLKSQLSEEATKRQRLEQENRDKAKADKYNLFLSQLAQLVPDFQEIVATSDFLHKYMKEVDPYSGIRREDLFNSAEDDGDVSRVASFFIDYKNHIATKDNVLEQSITPSGTNGVPNPTRGETPKWNITPQFISDFYDALAQGHPDFKGATGKAKADEIEAAIDQFVINGGLKR